MADAFLQVAPDSTGQKIDNSSLSVGSNTVLRQRTNISDPTTAAAIAGVGATLPGASDYGLIVREASQGQQTMAASRPVVIASNQTAIPISGTFWQTTQPVSLASLPSLAAGSNTIGSVTQSGGPWTMTGTGTAGTPASGVITIQGVSGGTAVRVDGSAVTQPVSMTTLPAGTNNIGTVYIQGLPQTTVTGTITSSTSIVGGATDYGTASNVTVYVSGVYTGVNMTFEVSADSGASWAPTMGTRIESGINDMTTGAISGSATTVARAWNFSLIGYNRFRVRATAYSSGTATVMVDPGTMPFMPSVGAIVQTPARNTTSYFMAIPVITTATDTLMSLTGFKSGANVTATTTPAVVTANKTLRITSIAYTYVATTTGGTAKFTIRANPTGVASTSSPAVYVVTIGGPALTAGAAMSQTLSIPDGLEFPAGTGIGITMQGLGSTQSAAATGYATISVIGYEY